MILYRSKAVKRTKHKSSSSFDCQMLPKLSLPSAQPWISPGWRQECGVHECFMTMSARCYVSGWCGTPWCATLAIINLELSAGGPGQRNQDRTGNGLFHAALDFSWCCRRKTRPHLRPFPWKSFRKTVVVAWRQQEIHVLGPSHAHSSVLVFLGSKQMEYVRKRWRNLAPRYFFNVLQN